jgi:hypothetical protein
VSVTAKTGNVPDMTRAAETLEQWDVGSGHLALECMFLIWFLQTRIVVSWVVIFRNTEWLCWRMQHSLGTRTAAADRLRGQGKATDAEALNTILRRERSWNLAGTAGVSCIEGVRL